MAGRSAWRGLGIFWAAVLLLAGGGAAALQVLGPPRPPPAPVHAAAQAPPAHAAELPPAVPPGIARPDPSLLARVAGSPSLMLPVVGADGRAARTVYAAPAPDLPAGAKRVALLVGSFGKSERDSRAALAALPGPAGIAVSAYAASSAGPLLEQARAEGHELYASIPMEPDGYPLNDEGVRSLRPGLSPADNDANLAWSLGQTAGAVGATGASDGMRGERFATLQAALEPVLREVGRRGLLYIDPRPGAVLPPGLLARSVDVVLDDSVARADIEAKLLALERVANEKGSAVGLAGQLRPVTLERLKEWAAGLGARNLVLVPVSTLVETTK